MRCRATWDCLAHFWEPFQDSGAVPADIDSLAIHGSIHGRTLLVGAGQGLLCSRLNHYASTLYTVDWSIEMLRRASLDDCFPVCADASSLPFASSSFDSILIASGVLELDNPSAGFIIAESARLLRPGSMLHLVIPWGDEAWMQAGRELGVIIGRRLFGARLLVLLQGESNPVGVVQRLTGVYPREAADRVERHRTYLVIQESLIKRIAHQLGGNRHLATRLIRENGLLDNYFPSRDELFENIIKAGLIPTKEFVGSAGCTLCSTAMLSLDAECD